MKIYSKANLRDGLKHPFLDESIQQILFSHQNPAFIKAPFAGGFYR